MTDLISRQAAIEATCYNCTEKEICNGICDDTDRLRELPTIDPVKHGMWVTKDDKTIVCSLCGDTWCGMYGFVLKYLRYCPNCGAKMDGGEE